MNDLADRLFGFTLRTILFLRSLPYNEETRVIRHQLIKSVSSVGANYEESQAGSSRADFGNKVRIALKEARESNYWLRLIEKLEYQKLNLTEQKWLINESEELKKYWEQLVKR